MNKKGFMFIETIVMCSILMVGLLLIYNSYRSSIAQQKEKLNYNTTAGELKLYYFKEFFVNKNNIKCNANYECVSNEVMPFDGHSAGKMGFYDITKLFVINCGDNVDPTEQGLYDLYNYIKTLKACKDERAYRFVAEFWDENSKKHSYAWLEYPIIES